MDATIEPMSIWQILDGGLRLYRRNFRRIFGASLLASLAGYVVTRLTVFGVEIYLGRLAPAGVSLKDLALLLLLTVVMSCVALAVTFIQWGVVATVAGDAYLGRDVPLEASLRRVPFWPLAGACAVAAVLVSAGSFCLIVPGVFFSIVLVFAPLVGALERRRPVQALRRSWALVRAPMPRGLMHNTVVRVTVIWAFAGVLSLLALAITLSVGHAAPASWQVEKTVTTQMGEWRVPLPVLQPAAQVAADIIAEAVKAFFRPFSLCALVLLYYDIRARWEGLDVRQLLDRAGGERAAH